MAQPHLTQVVKKYSDGTETVVNFNPNPRAEEIEVAVAQAVLEHTGEPVPEEVTASEVVSEVGETSGTEAVVVEDEEVEEESVEEAEV